MRSMILMAGSLALVVSGCAHAPAVAVLQPPEPPLRPGAVVEVAGDDASLQALVRSQLQEAGFVTASADRPADFIVQATLAEKPRQVGAASIVGEGEPPRWIEQGTPWRPWRFSHGAQILSIVIVDRQGRTVFRSRAAVPYRKQANPAETPRLVEAALEALAPQAASDGS